MHLSVLRVGSIALLAAVAATPALLAQQQGGQGQRGGQQGGGQQPGAGQAGGGQTLQVGENAPSLTLKDIDGQTHSLQQHRGEVVVLEWIDPTNRQWVQQHQQNGDLKRTYERYKEQGVTWMAVCSYRDQGMQGQQGGMQGGQQQQQQQGGMQQQEKAVLPIDEQQAKQTCERLKQDLGFDFPILLDKGGHVARQFKIEKLPYIVIVDQQGRVAFNGSFDQLTGVAQGGGIQQFERAIDRAVRGEPSLPAGSPREQGQQQTPPRQGQQPRGQ